MKKKTQGFYSEEFKWQVVQDVLEGKYSKEEARRMHNIKSKCAVLYWMRKFSGNDNYRQGGVPLGTKKTMSNMKELSEKDRRIKELEKLLERESLRGDLLEKIVSIAEEQFNIEIRKKYGAKQFSPSKSNKKTK